MPLYYISSQLSQPIINDLLVYFEEVSCFVTVDFITFVVGAFQSLLEGVFTLEDLCDLSIYYFYKGYTIVHLLRFTTFVPFSIHVYSLICSDTCFVDNH